jgi:hypothetical protein
MQTSPMNYDDLVSCRFAERRFAKRHFAERRFAKTVQA